MLPRYSGNLAIVPPSILYQTSPVNFWYVQIKFEFRSDTFSSPFQSVAALDSTTHGHWSIWKHCGKQKEAFNCGAMVSAQCSLISIVHRNCHHTVKKNWSVTSSFYFSSGVCDLCALYVRIFKYHYIFVDGHSEQASSFSARRAGNSCIFPQLKRTKKKNVSINLV